MIISVANQKGGVGKTTTTVNLAHWFAMRGLRVLVVDFDVQGHAATCLGKPKGNGLFRLLVNEEAVHQAAIHARPNLDLVTSNKTSERIKLFLSDQGAPALYVGEALGRAAKFYDMTILDLAPGSDVLHVGALVGSDYYLIPASMEFLALDGVVEVMRTAQDVGRIPHVDPPALIGVAPTRYERVPLDVKENIQRLGSVVGMDKLLPPIPKDVHVPEASARGMTIWEYAPETAAAIGYENGSQVKNSLGRTGGYLHLAEIAANFVR